MTEVNSAFRREKMGILVCYDDYTYDVINDYHLDYLLGKGCIIGYDSSGNWCKTEDETDAILLTELATEPGPASPNQR
jgi:hypothetical protein